MNFSASSFSVGNDGVPTLNLRFIPYTTLARSGEIPAFKTIEIGEDAVFVFKHRSLPFPSNSSRRFERKNHAVPFAIPQQAYFPP